MNKLLPWLTSIALAIALATVHVHYKSVIAAKDAELLTANEQNASLVAEANSKLKDAGEKVNAANEKLQQVSSEARARLQALATEANEKLQAANQPEPTVLVSFRKAFLGSGGVATLKNSSPQPISVSLVASRSATNQQRQFDLVIDAAMFKEIGEREGWAFLSGDTLQVAQPSHKVVSFTFK